jgi:ATP-dependent exoDNAse (exonuclease V) beta subunit
MARYISNFQKFYDWWKESHVLIKSELVVGDVETGICGCIDNLSYDFKNQQIVLFDYKSNKEIKTKGRNKMLGKLSHLDDCELVIYSLQLWIYSLILKRNSPFEIQQTPQILWLSGDKYELYPILPLEKEANLILSETLLLG